MEGVVLLLVLVGLGVGVGIALVQARERAARKQEERERAERKRKEDCYGLVRFAVNELGYVCRDWLSRDELDALIEGADGPGVTSDELADLFFEKLRATPGITLGEHVGSGLPVKLTERFRARHLYLIGRSGSGKTTLIRQMIGQDLGAGRGIGVLAPEAEMIQDEILPFLPRSRVDDVVYVNPGEDKGAVFSLNPLHLEEGEDLDLKVDETTTVLRRLMGEHASGPRMDEILRQTLYALTPYPGSTLLDVSRFLSRQDDGFRREVLAEIRDEQAEAFFVDTYPTFPKDAHLPVTNRLGKFIRSAPVRRLLCAPGPALSLRQIMDDGLVLLVNLSDGILGAENAQIIGQLVVAKMQLAAMSRANVPPERRRPFTVYLDEFQAFTTTSARSYEILLSRARKYGVSLVLAHQQTGQLGESLLKEILGNVSTVIAFAVGAGDARKIGHELVGEQDGEMVPTAPETLLGLNPGQAVCRIGKSCFRMDTALPSQRPDPRIRAAVIAASRRHAAAFAATGTPGLTRDRTDRHADAQDAREGQETTTPARPPAHVTKGDAPATARPASPSSRSRKKRDEPGSWVDRVEPGLIWGGTEDEGGDPNAPKDKDDDGLA